MRVKRAVVVFRKIVPLDRPLGLMQGQRHALATVKKVLTARHIRFTTVERERFRGPGRADLVIAVGGDGTFLTASHKIGKTPLMGINATPKHSVAFFSAATADRFANRLDHFIAGRLKCKPISRLQVRLNEKRIVEPILNEVLFCHPSPAGTARYRLKAGGKTEDQRSSGVLVATAAGTSGLTRSAGGRRLPLSSPKIQLVIREPYEPIGSHYRLKKKILPASARVVIISRMAKGQLFIDGSHIKYRVRFGDRIEVKCSPHPLFIVR